MKKMLETLTGSYSSSARVVDGKLILSFPDALKPVLWQMDLGGVKASALEVNDNDNVFTLSLRTPKGETHDIAPFDTRSKAVKALMVVSSAMERAQGQIRPGAPAPRSSALVPVAPAYAGADGQPAGTGQTVIRWLTALTGIVVLAILMNALWTMSPRAPMSVASANSPELAKAAPAQENVQQTGVAVSADDFLKQQ